LYNCFEIAPVCCYIQLRVVAHNKQGENMYVEEWINNLEKTLPDVIAPTQLIKAGIFCSSAQAFNRRMRKQEPEFLRLSTARVVYPKKGVIAWLRKKLETTNAS
jgi:hypothetical protein